MPKDIHYNSVIFQTDFDPAVDLNQLESDPNAAFVSAIQRPGLQNSTTLYDELGNTWTASGNAKHDLTQSPFNDGNGSAVFDGDGDYFTYSAANAGAFGTGDFTIECWFRKTGANQILGSDSSNNCTLVACGSGSTQWRIYVRNNDSFVIDLREGATWLATPGFSHAFELNRWYHVAVARKSGVIKSFLDGVEKASVAEARAIANTGSIYIGWTNVGNYYSYWNGQIAEARVTKGFCRYDSSFTITQKPNAIAKSFTAPVRNYMPSIKSYALTCNNTNAIVLRHNQNYNMGNGDYTIEFYVKVNTVDGNTRSIISHTASTSTFLGWHLNVNTATTGFATFDFSFSADGSNVSRLVGAQQNVIIGKWQHISVVKNGFAYSLFVDGIFISQQISTINFDFAAPLIIGMHRHFAYGVIGEIGSIRITKGIARYTLPQATSTIDPMLKATTFLLTSEASLNTTGISNNVTKLTYRLDALSYSSPQLDGSVQDDSDSNGIIWYNTPPDIKINFASKTYLNRIRISVGQFNGSYNGFSGLEVWDSAKTTKYIDVNNLVYGPNNVDCSAVPISATQFTLVIKNPFSPPNHSLAELDLFGYTDPGSTITNPDVFWSNVVLFPICDAIAGSTTFIDGSPSARAMTVSGTVTHDTAFARFGSTSIKIGASSNLSFPGIAFAGDFTIEAWIYPTSLSGDNPIFVCTAAGANNLYFALRNNAIEVDAQGTTAIINSLYAGNTQANRWQYISLSRVNGTMYVHLNGMLLGSVANTTNWTNTATMYFGSGPLIYFDGYKITNNVGRYGPANYDPWALTNAVDKIGNSTVTETPWVRRVTDQVSLYNTSFALTGSATADRIELSSSSAFNLGTGDFTIEMRIHPLTIANEPVIYDQWIGGGGSYTIGQLEIWLKSNGVIQFIIATSSTVYTTFTTSTNFISANAWHHIAFVRSNGVITAYVNGVASGSMAFTGQVGLTNRVDIGREKVTNNYYYTGYLEELRITKAARYTTNFTPIKSANSSVQSFLPETFVEGPATVSGNITDENGLPASRKVLLYDRASGRLLDATMSSASDGSYTLGGPAAETFIVVLDDDAGSSLPALIRDRVVPA